MFFALNIEIIFQILVYYWKIWTLVVYLIGMPIYIGYLRNKYDLQDGLQSLIMFTPRFVIVVIFWPLHLILRWILGAVMFLVQFGERM